MKRSYRIFEAEVMEKFEQGEMDFREAEDIAVEVRLFQAMIDNCFGKEMADELSDALGVVRVLNP